MAASIWNRDSIKLFYVMCVCAPIGVTDELEKFGSDLSTQLSERNLAEAPGGAAMATAGIGSGFGPSFIPAIEGSTSVLYFDHLVHGTPDDHVEAAARCVLSYLFIVHFHC